VLHSVQLVLGSLGFLVCQGFHWDPALRWLHSDPVSHPVLGCLVYRGSLPDPVDRWTRRGPRHPLHRLDQRILFLQWLHLLHSVPVLRSAQDDPGLRAALWPLLTQGPPERLPPPGPPRLLVTHWPQTDQADPLHHLSLVHPLVLVDRVNRSDRWARVDRAALQVQACPRYPRHRYHPADQADHSFHPDPGCQRVQVDRQVPRVLLVLSDQRVLAVRQHHSVRVVLELHLFRDFQMDQPVP